MRRLTRFDVVMSWRLGLLWFALYGALVSGLIAVMWHVEWLEWALGVLGACVISDWVAHRLLLVEKDRDAVRRLTEENLGLAAEVFWFKTHYYNFAADAAETKDDVKSEEETETNRAT